MSFYQINLAVFAMGSGYLLWRQYQTAKANNEAQAKEDEEENMLEPGTLDAAVKKFQWDFFLVYGLAVAADWLQGPHIYAIYKYEKNIPEKMVAALYASGFISGAVSASFAGQLADRYGRRMACLLYCATYALTCATMFSDNLMILFIGRLFGGVSTTLLFSVFEAWMITEYHARGLGSSKLALDAVFGRMTSLSCIVAIVCGVVGDVLVAQFGSRVWPFVASIFCSGFAAYFILQLWRENFGAKSTSESTSVSDVKSGIVTIIRNKHILALGVTSCFFEGAMYLFIFFWSAALTAARNKAGSTETLPFGLIFSSFMCSMMVGSAFFSLFPGRSSTGEAGRHTRDSTTQILTAVVLLVSACLSGAALLTNEYLLFWVMCAFEACIGAYFPAMGFLKSEVVEDGVRGRVYSILRMPLNVFVVVAHSLDEEGDGHRNNVFLTCAGLLILASFVIVRNFSRD